MAIAIALVLLVIGTVAFHFMSPWWFTPIASNWGLMDDTVNLTFWVTGAVFVAVNLFMAYAIVRYRHRKGHERRRGEQVPRIEESQPEVRHHLHRIDCREEDHRGSHEHRLVELEGQQVDVEWRTACVGDGAREARDHRPEKPFRLRWRGSVPGSGCRAG